MSNGLPQPFHPDASHINPDYRDGWNACLIEILQAIEQAEKNPCNWPSCKSDEYQQALAIKVGDAIIGCGPETNISLNVRHPKCYEAADAFWAYWNENGIPHKHGYYESTWGAINRAIRMVGVVPRNYTSSPTRAWIGLTEDEVLECWDGNAVSTARNFEAALKQKNTA